MQLAARLQLAIAEPFSIDASRVFVTASVGFCQVHRSTPCSGADLMTRAETALRDARANGSGSIRAYLPNTKPFPASITTVNKDVVTALGNGQIRPWFQPQVSTDTGEISGFEALARWVHPDHGAILPDDFLPSLEELNLLGRLSEVMLAKSLAAIRHWDRCGYSIPRIAVNFSSQELSDPNIVDRLKWDLDRFELTPQRVSIEVLEDVIADSRCDVIVSNIKKASDLGCKVDLDNFGTGHASIANIRRFAVNRIKIDRSFVTNVDHDPEQKNMVAAILNMAERLDIDTLAEGVETLGEHAALAQLGCGHVQGFSIAKPMPIEQINKWIVQYRRKLPDVGNIGRKAC
jgi:EAL domain-containing protein (putative c-di-GMP-specific phosphodiesterase class I)